MDTLHITKRSAIYHLLLLLILACTTLNIFGILDLDIDIEGLVIIGICSVFCIGFIGLITPAPSERLVLTIGYAVRLLWLYVDIYKDIVLTGGGSDADGFWNNAIGRYHGLEMPEYTKYPYLIKILLHVFGENRLLVQYVNIWVWLFAILVLYKCFNLLGIKNKRIRLVGMMCFCFLPEYILLTSTLMRESMIVLLNTFSMYYFLKWFQNQKFSDIVLAEFFVLLSMILHSGAIGLGAAYGIAYALYDKRKRQVCISTKTVIIGTVGIVAVFIIFISPFSSAALAYLPKLNNLFELQSRWFDETGGSNYLMDMAYTENPIIFLRNTIIRMIYFYASPIPWEWRGIKDIFAFCIDTAFHVFVIALGIFSRKKGRENRILIRFLLMCILMIGIVFAWGVSNAGAAMRHRCKLIGVEIVLMALCATKEKNYTEMLKRQEIERL